MNVRSHTSRRLALLVAAPLCASGLTFGQGAHRPATPRPLPTPSPCEYDVVALGPLAGASITSASDVTEAGIVVGTSYFASPAGERGWVWTASQGYQVLPQPPVGSSYRAIGINEAGVIAGDGGVDFGVVWRFEDGAYEVLGTLEGDSRSTAAAINELGEIAGTSRTLSISDPPRSFRAGSELEEILSGSQASFINDSGQVVGWTTSLSGFRWSPGTGVEYLPPLGQHVLVYPWAANSGGDVVGSASHANGNASVPFLFTDEGRMQQIGSFGGGASAADVSDDRTVVGNFSVGGTHPWIWTEAHGLRFLDDLIDPALGIDLLSVKRITENGRLLCRATDPSFARYPVLLIPTF